MEKHFVVVNPHSGHKDDIPPGQIIYALPGSGKTYAASEFQEHVDTDWLVSEFLGHKASRQFMLKLLKRPALRRQLRQLISGYRAAGFTVLTNMMSDKLFPTNIDLFFTFRSVSEYREHLELVGRVDLLNKFSPKDMERWLSEVRSQGGATFYLEPGQHLSVILSELYFDTWLTGMAEGMMPVRQGFRK